MASSPVNAQEARPNFTPQEQETCHAAGVPGPRKRNLIEADLEEVLAQTRDLWEEVRGKRLFITGGTGFFGCWLLESFAWACDRLDLGAEAVVLTRRPEVFAHKAAHLAGHPAIRLHQGDVRSFAFPAGAFSHVIHAATESSTTLNDVNPLEMLDTITQGTRRTLDFAVACGAEKLLFTSSGAVYGRQPSDMTHIPEDYPGAPDTMDPRSAYGEGKRMGELLCAIYAGQHDLQVKIARCFAFVGPYLPLNAHFAIGNFIRDALAGDMIEVKGDGTPYRSYLYAADLAIWLWKILFQGVPRRPYNVGSTESLPISELARKVAACVSEPALEMRVTRDPVRGRAPERYVPDTQRAAHELDLRQRIDLGESIRRTFNWHVMQGCLEATAR